MIYEEVDSFMLDVRQFENLIVEPTLKELGLYSRAALKLVMGTAITESSFKYLKQKGGPALGIYQMEPFTHDDIWKNFLVRKKELSDNIILASAECSSDELVYNLKYATAMCRIQYYRVPDPLPDYNDIQGLAQYWKDFYNTRLGKGKVEDFVRRTSRIYKGD
jgi:hypothetical protein